MATTVTETGLAEVVSLAKKLYLALEKELRRADTKPAKKDKAKPVEETPAEPDEAPEDFLAEVRELLDDGDVELLGKPGSYKRYDEPQSCVLCRLIYGDWSKRKRGHFVKARVHRFKNTGERNMHICSDHAKALYQIIGDEE